MSEYTCRECGWTCEADVDVHGKTAECPECGEVMDTDDEPNARPAPEGDGCRKCQHSPGFTDRTFSERCDCGYEPDTPQDTARAELARIKARLGDEYKLTECCLYHPGVEIDMPGLAVARARRIRAYVLEGTDER